MTSNTNSRAWRLIRVTTIALSVVFAWSLGVGLAAANPPGNDTPLELSDPAQARSWFRSHFLNNKKLFTRSEIQALKKYSVSPAVNVMLRRGRGRNMLAERNSLLLQQAENLDSALTHIRLERPLVVYRGFDRRWLNGSAPKSGSQISDRGFVSTSVLENIASGYALKTAIFGKRGFVAKITLPTGSCVAAPGLNGIGRFANYEIMLPRNSHFQIKRKIKTLHQRTISDLMTQNYRDDHHHRKPTGQQAKDIRSSSRKADGKVHVLEMSPALACPVASK